MKKIQIISLATGVAFLAGCASESKQSGYPKQVSFDQLPRPAQQTVRNELGAKQITRIDEDTKNGQLAYRVEVQKEPNSWSTPSLWVTPQGQILKESSQLSQSQEINEPAGAEATPEAPTSTRTDPDYQ